MIGPLLAMALLRFSGIGVTAPAGAPLFALVACVSTVAAIGLSAAVGAGSGTRERVAGAHHGSRDRARGHRRNVYYRQGIATRRADGHDSPRRSPASTTAPLFRLVRRT
jgi:hypothetical protein